MNIAYYEHGNLGEKENYGLGSIYDENGNLIMKYGEYIIASFKGRIKISIIRSKGRFIGEYIFLEKRYGENMLYRTNQRIVYIREPSFWSHTTDIGFVPDAGHMLWAKNWKERNYK